MNIIRYFPSAQFGFIVGAILFSGGLVVAAYEITRPDDALSVSQLVVSTDENENWLESLRQVQAQNSDYAAPQAPDENTVGALLEAAQTSNLTDSIGRSLVVTLGEAKAQGLGADAPTQDKLIAEAASQIEKERGAQAYTLQSLTRVDTTAETQKAYGNAVITTLLAHPKASYPGTIMLIGYAADYRDEKKLAQLSEVQAAYEDLSNQLKNIPVPETIAPLHLQIVNNFAQISELYTDMRLILQDPLRGLAGLQLYESLVGETNRVFTNIAQQLSSNGILFNTNEPGSAWNTLVP